MPQILKHKSLEHWTGGSMGVVIVKPDAPAGLPLSQDQWLYFFTLVWAVLLFFVRMEPAARPRRPRARRDPRPADRGAGDGRQHGAVQVAHVRRVGVLHRRGRRAGARSPCSSSSPDSFSIFLSLTLVVGIVVGGLASISGALYGALFIQFIPNVADQISKAAPWAIYGVFLIGFMYVMPSGVAGLIQVLRRRFRKK